MRSQLLTLVFLTNIEDWTEDVASVIAQQEGIELTQKDTGM